MNFIKKIKIRFKKYRNEEIKEEKFGWSGIYDSWAEAEKYSIGYEGKHILEKCKKSLLKLKKGEAVFERDGVLFDKVQYNWVLLSFLQKSIIFNKGELNLLDFGGSLGSSYFQSKLFLEGVKTINWCIIEQDHFVTSGKHHFENKELKFFYTIEESAKIIKPNIILLSGVLQYIEKPYELLKELKQLSAQYIVIDRLSINETDKDIVSVQNVDPQFYATKLCNWFFSLPKLIDYMKNEYELVLIDHSYAENKITIDNTLQCDFKIVIFKKK